jgi:hypothetical protein
MNVSRALLLVLAAGCAADPLPEDVAGAEQAVAQAVTISGRVFYNDRRDHGLFSARRTPSGAVGTKCGTSGASCTVRSLGGQYMVVDVIERDTGYFAPTDWNCRQEDVLTSVAVAYDGSFTATFTPSDGCNNDDFDDFAITLRVRLRYCGSEWCISVGPDDQSPYALDYPGATTASPLIVRAGQTRVLGDMSFRPAGTSAGDPNDHAVAANLYASLVDTALTVHRDAGVPFYDAEFGELHYVYPSGATSTATTKTASKVVHRKAIEWETDSGWTRGNTPPHEYGHVMMLRAWDGDYGFDGVGISANDSERAPSRQIAFKEAWAEYVSRAVMVETRPCDGASFDDNATTPLPGPLGDGAAWRLNVTKALCDWADARRDDDPALAGAGDHFAASGLYSMWENLRQMYLTADQYGGDYSGEGLWFCDYVDYYLDVRKDSDPAYVSSITDLVYNNNIGCYLPSP